jgi:farnesyl diphosphate synthase
MSFDLKGWMYQRQDAVERALSQWVPKDAPAGLGEAMRYAVLDGGKRLRPLLVFAAAEVSGGARSLWSHEAAMRAACAVELIHAYSLVHDDMPCMDNDVLRRGKPTVHVKFGEAQALLAGDALQALAFEILVSGEPSRVPPAVQARQCKILAQAAGSNGMAGGQAIDLAAVGRELPEEELRRMHQLKTGALLQASVALGAACVQLDEPQGKWLMRYGQSLGLAFQVVDDILDVTADTATLGKTAGKDAAADKPTYVSVMGMDGARSLARELHRDAIAALACSGLGGTAALRALADVVIKRDH